MGRALVLGGGGFIGTHLVTRLKGEGSWVRAVDLNHPEFSESDADEFVIGDLRDVSVCRDAIAGGFDEIYQLAADMGGAGFVFTGDNDAAIMHNSAQINLNMVEVCRQSDDARRIFYSSSACMYPAHVQDDPDNPGLQETDAYPANPDSEYGWEKLFSERLYRAYARNHRLEVRIARFHNIFGPLGTWTGGREKSPAALCRKVAEAEPGGDIEIWGDGEQTRSFLYVDECLDAVTRLMRSDCADVVNIGSEEMVSINQVALMIADIAGKDIRLKHVPGPLGVRGRNSDNSLIEANTGWRPRFSLREGLAKTYPWIARQVELGRASSAA